MTGQEAPTPWRPDGEGWDTYRLSGVRGLEWWEIEAPGDGFAAWGSASNYFFFND